MLRISETLSFIQSIIFILIIFILYSSNFHKPSAGMDLIYLISSQIFLLLPTPSQELVHIISVPIKQSLYCWWFKPQSEIPDHTLIVIHPILPQISSRNLRINSSKIEQRPIKLLCVKLIYGISSIPITYICKPP